MKIESQRREKKEYYTTPWVEVAEAQHVVRIDKLGVYMGQPKKDRGSYHPYGGRPADPVPVALVSAALEEWYRIHV